jgi:hypothetical protein
MRAVRKHLQHASQRVHTMMFVHGEWHTEAQAELVALRATMPNYNHAMTEQARSKAH